MIIKPIFSICDKELAWYRQVYDEQEFDDSEFCDDYIKTKAILQYFLAKHGDLIAKFSDLRYETKCMIGAEAYYMSNNPNFTPPGFQFKFNIPNSFGIQIYGVLPDGSDNEKVLKVVDQFHVYLREYPVVIKDEFFDNYADAKRVYLLWLDTLGNGKIGINYEPANGEVLNLLEYDGQVEQKSPGRSKENHIFIKIKWILVLAYMIMWGCWVFEQFK